jgi:hypothetical protein
MASGKYTYRFDGNYTGIDTLINVDGYYHNQDGTYTINYFMFYRDGTFATDILNTYKTNKIDIDSIYYIGGWGKYIIIGDTIKIQSICVYGYVRSDVYTDAPVDIFYREFKIINKDTLIEILFKDIKNPDNPSYSHKNWEFLNKPAYFTPLPNRPDSSCWLKNNSWAWKDGKIIK